MPDSSCLGHGDMLRYVTGVLANEKVSLFEAHLPNCERCRELNEEMHGWLAEDKKIVDQVNTAPWNQIKGMTDMAIQEGAGNVICPIVERCKDEIRKKTIYAGEAMKILCEISHSETNAKAEARNFIKEYLAD